MSFDAPILDNYYTRFRSALTEHNTGLELVTFLGIRADCDRFFQANSFDVAKGQWQDNNVK